MKDIDLLPAGQRKSVIGLVGSKRARTYIEASEVAGISVNTLYTHLRRIRTKHPGLYRSIYKKRKAQLKVRHEEALDKARDHTREYFKRVRKWERWLFGGWV